MERVGCLIQSMSRLLSLLVAWCGSVVGDCASYWSERSLSSSVTGIEKTCALKSMWMAKKSRCKEYHKSQSCEWLAHSFSKVTALVEDIPTAL